LSKVQESVVAATKVSERTVRKIIKERKQCEEQGTSFGTPEKSIIYRNIILEIWDSNGRKQGIRERPDIISMRIAYLRTIKKYREKGRPTYAYNIRSETYIHSTHTHTHTHTHTQDLKTGVVIALRIYWHLFQKARVQLLFMEEVDLNLFLSNRKTGDYHHEMNSEEYMKWLNERLIPNLPSRSVLVIDNAPYHNGQLDKIPTMSSTKSVILNNVPFEQNLLKVELYSLIKARKPLWMSIIDKVLTNAGHSVLRLPTYSSDHNQI
ncbi:hypothetical protein C0J52_24751, partial [Blattella germanica]